MAISSFDQKVLHLKKIVISNSSTRNKHHALNMYISKLKFLSYYSVPQVVRRMSGSRWYYLFIINQT